MGINSIKWFFVYKVKTASADSSDVMERLFSEKITIKIEIPASNKNDAKKLAKTIWDEKCFENIPYEFTRLSDIDEDYDLKFYNPHLIREYIENFPLEI